MRAAGRQVNGVVDTAAAADLFIRLLMEPANSPCDPVIVRGLTTEQIDAPEPRTRS
jgi:hypothetical protein